MCVNIHVPMNICVTILCVCYSEDMSMCVYAVLRAYRCIDLPYDFTGDYSVCHNAYA